MEKLRRSTTSEVARLEAAHKKSELKIQGLERSLEQKVQKLFLPISIDLKVQPLTLQYHVVYGLQTEYEISCPHLEIEMKCACFRYIAKTEIDYSEGDMILMTTQMTLILKKMMKIYVLLSTAVYRWQLLSTKSCSFPY